VAGTTKGGATEVSMVEFRAAARSGVLSEIVGMDDFGIDPIVLAVASREKEKRIELRVENISDPYEHDIMSSEIDEGVAGGSSGQAGGSNISLHNGSAGLV